MAIKLPPLYPDSKDKKSYESGMEYQDFVAKVLMDELGIPITIFSSAKWQWGLGETKQGIEIKLDRDISRTGNVSIEIAEKAKAANASWVPSGIYTANNTWLYVQGNYDILFIFGKKTLQSLAQHFYQQTPLPTIKRFLMPLGKADIYALKTFIFHPELFTYNKGSGLCLRKI